MPKVFEYNGFKFFFLSNEGSPREPVHVHVSKGDGLAKVWIEPDIAIGFSRGFSAADLRVILSQVELREEEIRRVWNEHFD